MVLRPGYQLDTGWKCNSEPDPDRTGRGMDARGACRRQRRGAKWWLCNRNTLCEWQKGYIRKGTQWEEGRFDEDLSWRYRMGSRRLFQGTCGWACVHQWSSRSTGSGGLLPWRTWDKRKPGRQHYSSISGWWRRSWGSLWNKSGRCKTWIDENSIQGKSHRRRWGSGDCTSYNLWYVERGRL